jgi:MoaA/NifB/PqqE/SkfB family radical SAM enzyme
MITPYVIPRPTRCAVIDLGRPCQAKCQFCYYALQDGPKQWVHFDVLKTQVDLAKQRGNTLIDLTGGETTLMPRIEEFIDYIHEKGMRVCMITNGLVDPEKVKGLIDKVDLWRFSMHNMEEIHDKVVGVEGARIKQLRFITAVQDHIVSNKSESVGFHVNMVLCKQTQYDLEVFATWLLRIAHVKQFNIINFLPHYEWGKLENTKRMVADLREVEPHLNAMFDILEDAGVGCNIRYYPMCRIREDLRRTVCNDLQVMFDPWEWDYSFAPKTFAVYKDAGEGISEANECKGDPCDRCDIHKVCGGISKPLHAATNKGLVDPITNILESSFIKSTDDIEPFMYRKFNLKTLRMPWENM